MIFNLDFKISLVSYLVCVLGTTIGGYVSLHIGVGWIFYGRTEYSSLVRYIQVLFSIYEINEVYQPGLYVPT